MSPKLTRGRAAALRRAMLSADRAILALKIATKIADQLRQPHTAQAITMLTGTIDVAINDLHHLRNHLGNA